MCWLTVEEIRMHVSAMRCGCQLLRCEVCKCVLCLLSSTRSAQLTQECVQNSLLDWQPVTEAVGGVWGEQESAMTFLSLVLQSLMELDESAKALLCTRCDLEREAVCYAAGCPAHATASSHSKPLWFLCKTQPRMFAAF